MTFYDRLHHLFRIVLRIIHIYAEKVNIKYLLFGFAVL